ncbi:MAG: hypothetical protein MJ252_27540 [archaeon]|nr:hypothetical protein [archaeon]
MKSIPTFLFVLGLLISETALIRIKAKDDQVSFFGLNFGESSQNNQNQNPQQQIKKQQQKKLQIAKNQKQTQNDTPAKAQPIDEETKKKEELEKILNLPEKVDRNDEPTKFEERREMKMVDDIIEDIYANEKDLNKMTLTALIKEIHAERLKTTTPSPEQREQMVERMAIDLRVKPNKVESIYDEVEELEKEYQKNNKNKVLPFQERNIEAEIAKEEPDLSLENIKKIVTEITDYRKTGKKFTATEKEAISEKISLDTGVPAETIDRILDHTFKQEQKIEDETEYHSALAKQKLVSQGACGFNDLGVNARLYAGVSFDIFKSTTSCGGCMKVKGPGGQVVVRVVDSVKDEEQTLILSRDAYGLISDGKEDSMYNVEWTWVDCGYDDNIKVEVVPGTTQYYTAVRFYNSNKRIAVAEIYNKNKHRWEFMQRRGDFAFYTLNTVIKKKKDNTVDLPVEFRLTSVDGKMRKLKINGFNEDEMYTANTNF